MGAEKIEAQIIESKALREDADTDEMYKNLVRSNVALFDVNAQEVRLGINALSLVKVSDAENREAAYQLVKSANKARIQIDKRLKEVLAPFKRIIKALSDYAEDELTNPLRNAINRVDSAILIWDKEEALRKEEERKRLEVERLKIAEAEAAAQKKIDDDKAAELAKVQNSGDFAARQAKISAMPPGILRIKAQRDLDAEKKEAMAQVEGEAAKASQEARIDKGIALSDVRGKEEDLGAKVKGAAQTWEWEVVDFSQVNDQFKVLSDSAVRQAIKEGAQSIRGLRMWTVDKLRH